MTHLKITQILSSEMNLRGETVANTAVIFGTVVNLSQVQCFE